jgi:hypothetical protein
MPKKWSIGVLGVWVVAAVSSGALLTSFHQPFRAAGPGILRVAGADSAGQWRAVHFVAGGCACSQKVMKHLAHRGPVPGIVEEVVAVDGPDPYLSGSRELLVRLSGEGYRVRHVTAASLPADARLRGVPLLAVANPANEMVYAGGYGESGEDDVATIEAARAGGHPKASGIKGCAVGSRLQKQAL